jgi:hypothetical protein
MAYKVGTIIVIDDSGNVDWSRIANKPAIGSGDITSVSVANDSPTSGVGFSVAQFNNTSLLRASLGAPPNGNCNCVANCYVESLSGGGAAGDVTVTANRRFFNCNCNCACRC